MIITIANQKGGVGKSTLTILLAISLNKKYKVSIIDTDPQLSLYNNISVLENINLEVKKQELVSFINMTDDNNNDIYIVDTLPTTDINIINLFVKSDLIIVPTGANLLDVSASLNTINVLKNINKPYKIIFNNIKNSNDFKEIKEYFLKENLPVASNYLTSRVAYSRLFKNNLVIDDPKALAELKSLIDELV